MVPQGILCGEGVRGDESVVKLHGLRAYVWSAVDVDSGEVLAVYASWGKNIMVAMRFARMVLDRCLNKPLIIVDRDPWYPYALNLPIRGLVEEILLRGS